MGLAAPHKLGQDIAGLPDWLADQLVERPDNIVPIRQTYSPPADSLNGLVRMVSTAGKGERNSILFWSACRVSEMAATGKLGRQQFSGACNALVAAAMASGLPRKEAERTITSAMRQGR